MPCGFGCDFAGVVDEVGAGAEGLEVGDRVYGGALAKAVADFVVMKAPVAPPDVLFHLYRKQKGHMTGWKPTTCAVKRRCPTAPLAFPAARVFKRRRAHLSTLVAPSGAAAR